MVKALAFLTDDQRAQMPAWAERWIRIGLSTEPMDLPRFSDGVRACYRFAKIEEPRVIVPVSSPLVLALAAPIAAQVIWQLEPEGQRGTGRGAVRDAGGDAD